MSHQYITKVTLGWINQVYDLDTKRFVAQEFMESEDGGWEIDGSKIKGAFTYHGEKIDLDALTLEPEMVQP